MPLRKRILIGYGITLALMATVVIWAVLNLVSLGQASDAILRENYKSILAAENMIDAIERQDSATLLVMLDYDDQGLAQFRENENHFLQWLGRAKDNGTIESATEAMKLGAVDFIQKPFAPKEIRELVNRVLDRDTIEADKAKGYGEHIELAKRCIGEREFDAAQEHVRQAIAADSTKPEALNLLGALIELRGDWLEALKEYRAALALDPAYKPADANLARVVIRHEMGQGISFGNPQNSKEEQQ